MFDQYWKIRDLVESNTLLFYRMGDFYELFGQDAVIAAPLLEVQLTARNKDADIPIPMCGVPVHAIDSYAEKILARKYKVALCEQLSEPEEGKAKLVERGIVRILTPGLPVDHTKLDSKTAHYFLSLHVEQNKNKVVEIDAAVFDFLGAELFVGRLATVQDLGELLLRLDPKEILLSQACLSHPSLELAASLLLDPHQVWCARITPWASHDQSDAIANLKEYLAYTQRAKNLNQASMLPEAKALQRIFGSQGGDYAYVTHSVLTQWNVFPELLALLDGAGSVLGSRTLRDMLSRPLLNVERIQVRQKFFEQGVPEAAILARSKNVYDLERILGRFRVGVAAPRELLQLQQSLELLTQVMGELNHAAPLTQAFYRFEDLENYDSLLARVAPLLELMKRMLKQSSDTYQSPLLSDLICQGFDEKLDELRTLHTGAEDWLKNFEERLRSETQIPTLKVRYNRVFGYFVEVTKTHLSKVPVSFERKQTTVNGERFTLLELRKKEEEILSASSRLDGRAKELLESLQSELLLKSADLKALFLQFSWMDALAGAKQRVSQLRRFGDWTLPHLEAGEFFFELQNSRHPILESRVMGFVPNDLTLGRGSKRMLLLTGPNMAGKSTLMRQVGLSVLLAQCGLPVPASHMTLAPSSGFFSRMGAQDKILEGESTFMVEMKETAQILRECERNSFVLMDEIGRGTSTQDGLALAEAILEYLSEKSQSIGIFATHYHELSTKPLSLKTLQNASMAIDEVGKDLRFLHRLKNEAAESSYGLYVARLAGLPRSALNRAQFFLERALKRETLEAAIPDDQQNMFTMFKESRDEQSLRPDGATHSEGAPTFARLSDDVQMPDATLSLDKTSPRSATAMAELRSRIQALELEAMSPKEAWLLLEQIQKSFCD